MCSQQTLKPSEALRAAPPPLARYPLPLGLAFAMFSLLGLGCNSFSNGRLVKELQTENERLLAEFRAQRDRTAELEKVNQRQAERLAESEKLLARVTQSGGAGRLSSLPNDYSQFPNALPAGSSSRANPRAADSPADGPEGADALRWQPRLGTSR